MRTLNVFLALSILSCATYAQQNTVSTNATGSGKNGNIYTIKQQYQQQVLHNPAEHEEEGEDNELANFNRWFFRMEARTYPTGDLPSPDVLLRVQGQQQVARNANKTTAGGKVWQPVGPTNVPSNFNGIGRVNCIINPAQDTNFLFVGTACGGVWVSRNGGSSWYSSTDNFPSLSIADIAVNPKHMDTVYAATGDGYGYENGSFNIFWGGLYSAGIMMSTDTGHTWATTGLSYIQSNNDIIQKLLIHPNKTSIMLAATRNGLKRSTDAGATWSAVAPGHIYSMAFRPNRPDTVYAIDSVNLIVSYDAGASWSTLYSAINGDDRCTIAVSAMSPNSIWVLTNSNTLKRSYNGGLSFTNTAASPSATASFYGYYDRVLAVSPTDSNYILAFGKNMAKSVNNGNSWSTIDNSHRVHVDFHVATINPLRSPMPSSGTNATIYVGNDGGIAVSYNGGNSWKNLGNGLMISQIYRASTSRQDTNVMLCGLQDNGTFSRDAAGNWREVTGGDGMDNAICPKNDNFQISAYQYGNFFLSSDGGVTFNGISYADANTGAWVSPVVYNPNSTDTIYFGLKNIEASYDGGSTIHSLTSGLMFTNGAISLAAAPSASNVLYAGDYSRIMRTTDYGTTWTNISSGLPSAAAKTFIAVDYKDANKVYVTMSGYLATYKVYMSSNGGATWTNISTGLPNVPVSCIAVDSSTPGALFVGTDMGVYYRDDSNPTWALYNTGLPNVIVDDLDINYTDYKVRAATFGRGLWEIGLKKPRPSAAEAISKAVPQIKVFPNPTAGAWKVVFPGQGPDKYTLTVMDVAGRVLHTQSNDNVVDAAGLAKGVYTIEISSGSMHESLKAVKY